jgi:hypothetical protein
LVNQVLSFVGDGDGDGDFYCANVVIVTNANTMEFIHMNVHA